MDEVNAYYDDEVNALYDELVEKIKKYHPAKDYSMLEKAYHLARDAHEGQYRKSGEPYIIHPLKVAILLAELELDIRDFQPGNSSYCRRSNKTGQNLIFHKGRSSGGKLQKNVHSHG